MPSNIPMARLRKAFNEGRRSATTEIAENPYDNAKLRQLWEHGREQQRAGQITTPIPPLEHGETRAQRAVHNPPGSKQRGGSSRPSGPPRGGGGPRNFPRGGPPRGGSSRFGGRGPGR